MELHSFLHGRQAFPEGMLAVCVMILLLILCVSSAVMMPSTKRYLESKYLEMNRHTSRLLVYDPHQLRVEIKKYWVMAETSSPQFVVARSPTCALSDLLSLIAAVVLVEAEIRMKTRFDILGQSDSSYGWSTDWVLVTQTIGVLLGSVAPAIRCFAAVKSRRLNSSYFKNAVTVDFWTQKLVEWRGSPLSVEIRHLPTRKFLHHIRGLLISFLIHLQHLIVLVSKIILLISITASSTIINFGRLTKRQQQTSVSSPHHQVSIPTFHSDLNNYVMLLPGEVDLLPETIENISKDVDKVISKGRMRKPVELTSLLCTSSDELRVAIEFDSHHVESLDSHDPPYCWSLPVVTLACIALALPKIDKGKQSRLLIAVDEGLRYVKIVDVILDKKERLTNIRTAADVLWVEVELYHKWQDRDLDRTGENGKQILQQLRDEAKKTVMDLENSVMRSNPLNWPAKVIAANSMYRLSSTILLNHGDKTDEQLFNQLSIMVADVLTACLTNLVHVINKKCCCNVIEERERSVREAAYLLGETEDILLLLQQRRMPAVVAPHRGSRVEEWRVMMNKDHVSESREEAGHYSESSACDVFVK